MNLFGLFLVSAQLIPLSSSKIGKTTENRLPRAAQNAIDVFAMVTNSFTAIW